MREIPYNELVPGEEYYIHNVAPYMAASGNSGKKIGTFVRLTNDVPVRTEFRNLHDVPGARLRTGMGTITENTFSVLNTKYYLPENDQLYTKSIVRQKTGENYFDYGNTGGKMKKTKYRKSLKKRNKKSKKTNKRRRRT